MERKGADSHLWDVLRSSTVAIWSGLLITSVALAAAAPAPAPSVHPPATSAPATSTPATSTQLSELPLTPEQVVAHVSRTLSWYRRIVALQQLPIDADDIVPRDRLYQTALTSVRLVFDFGRSAASLAGRKPAVETQGAQNPVTATDQAAARMAARVADLQSQLSALDARLSHVSARARSSLTAKHGELAAELDLTKEIQATVVQIQHFEDMNEARTGSSSGDLAGQIADLRRSVPELRSGGSGENLSTGIQAGSSPTAKATAAHAGAVNAETFRPESAGIIALLGKWFSLAGTRRQLLDATKQTDGLQKDLEDIRATVTHEVRAQVQQNLEATSEDPAELLQSKLKFEEAARRFRELSTLLVPLGEQGVTLDGARSILQEWRDAVGARTATIARYVALRLVFLLGSIAVVLVISEVWRRATFRYLHDVRRRQQFLALRRVAVSLALVVVILFGLVSEVGSLATYAGLITAGLAVALQNVILAVVAYFFLIGRYGVRVGDRVTLAGVTGRVVEIGLIRIYLLELAGPQLRSTGRMVVLSNAVLFQPTAMFKQLPGSDFLWHTVKLTLASATDIEVAETRLRETAESVYDKYRSAIEQQHAALQRFIDFQTAMPAPEVYVRLTIKGLECTVRYPVDPSQAAATDQKMLLAIRQAQAKDPPLQVVDGPLLDAAEG